MVAANSSVVARLSTEPSWSRRPDSVDYPMHFHELQNLHYVEWRPTRRALPTICVVSWYTPNYVYHGSWATVAWSMNANWALGNGYKYSLFTRKLVNHSFAFGYTIPRTVLFMLEQGEEECAYAFGIDGDAVVNNLEHRLHDTIRAHMAGAHLLMTCNAPFGHGSEQICGPQSDPCRCSQLNASCSAVSEAARKYNCRINVGAYIARNNRYTREMIRWWSDGGYGKCKWIGRPTCIPGGTGKLECRPSHPSEQDCALQMRDQFREHMIIASARIMNLPSWFNSNAGYTKHKALEHHVNRRLNYPALQESNGGLTFNQLSRCFNDSALFVCHPYGIRNWTFRSLLFETLLRDRRQAIHAWMRSRGERVVSPDDLVARLRQI